METINLGSAPNNQTGDSARVAGQKINANFEELFEIVNQLARIDRIEAQTGFSEVVDGSITIYANWEWIINNQTFVNDADFEINEIAYSAAGKSRYVFIVPNEESGFDLIEGEESTSIPQTPPLPNSGIYATFFIVSDSDFGDPTAPVVGTRDELIIDKSLVFYDNDGIQTLGANVSNFTSSFTWLTGDSKIFTLPFVPINLIAIYINGVKIFNSSEYTLIIPNQIEILKTLANNDVLEFNYEHFNNL